MKNSIFVILLVLLLAACSDAKQSLPQHFLSNVNSTDLVNEQAGNMQLGDSEQSLKEKRGIPSEQYDLKFKNNGPYDTAYQSWEYGDVKYTVSNSKIVGYMLSGQLSTAKGIKIGASVETIKDLYGNEFYNRENGDFNYMGYLDKDREWVIEFVIEQEKVIDIFMSELSLFESFKN